MNYIRNHTLNQSEKSTLYHRYVLSTMVSFTLSTSNHSRSSYIISAGNSKPRGYQVILYCKWMWCFSQDQRANELNLTVMRNISGRIQSESLVDGLHPTRYATLMSSPRQKNIYFFLSPWYSFLDRDFAASRFCSATKKAWSRSFSSGSIQPKVVLPFL